MTDQTTDQFATIQTEGHVVTARLHGPNVGEREGGIILNRITAHVDQLSGPVKHIVLNFADVTFLNSAGIGSCIQIQNLAKKNGARTILYAVTADIQQVLKITRLDRLFKIADNEKQLAKLTR